MLAVVLAVLLLKPLPPDAEFSFLSWMLIGLAVLAMFGAFFVDRSRSSNMDTLRKVRQRRKDLQEEKSKEEVS